MLNVEGLRVSYGGLAALRGVSLEVRAGEVVGVVGPNGAGKSSLMNAIAGGIIPDKGQIRFADQDLVGMRPERIANLGLSLVPEGRHVFSTLTIEENLRMGTAMRRASQGVEARLQRVMSYFPKLKERRSTQAGALSGGEQQMLVIGRALMANPKLVLVDEPSLGLAPKIVDQVYQILRDLRREEGLTLLINEQSSKRVLKYADRVYVLRSGEIQLDKPVCELQDGIAIMQAYFGFNKASQQSTTQP